VSYAEALPGENAQTRKHMKSWPGSEYARTLEACAPPQDLRKRARVFVCEQSFVLTHTLR
jgi:hypothetical protein